MTVLPVLDLLGGVVVRGVAGRRDAYRPVESCLSKSADALAVARGFRNVLGLTELYVADLDAILHQRPNAAIYQALAADGFDIMVDAGLSDVPQAAEVVSSGAQSLVAGLETIPGPQLLASLCGEFGSERVVFSLDLKEGRPLTEAAEWETADPFEIGVQAIQAGIERMIVLDLARVGRGEGVQTDSLCHRLRQFSGQLQLITGGGVRDAADLDALRRSQIDAVLVASALHDGRIGRAEIAALHSSE